MDTKRYVFEALTRHNYFPNQKLSIKEIPPCFGTTTFTPEVAQILAQTKKEAVRGRLGYDHVEYAATRHNNVPRKLGLVHPRAYADLVTIMHSHWDHLAWVCENDRSMIKPELHQDGRMLVMNYEDPNKKIVRELNDSFASSFRVTTDISGCFPGIYSHAIEWALDGIDSSKERLRDRGPQHWSSDLDRAQRQCKRNETQGIPIGPASSSIVVEVILGKVDQELAQAGFNFRRHIDDYVCYCSTLEQTDAFLQTLGKLLRNYKLNLNLHKTSVVDLPAALQADWVAELNGALPSRFITQAHNARTLLGSEVIQYLNFAIRLNKQTPDGSVLKYAIGSIINFIDPSGVYEVFDYILNLSWYFPLLLPYLEILIEKDYFDTSSYGGQLNTIALLNAKSFRSDGISWPLYYLKKHNLPIDYQVIDAVLASEDCLGLLSLYQFEQAQEMVVNFASRKTRLDVYSKDQYWLLLYQLYLDQKLANPYMDDCFPVLQQHAVNFMVVPNQPSTPAELYCDYLDNPFREEDEPILPYLSWLKSRKK
ncbi:antiviral reverse transcriptase Drt4 [Herbaspirillum sp. 1130]|uniref:antiviral reverse transcriptase Drt4 n=1 Tax=Herbaspirillum sp. 1130 TaxID=2806562 RepID=UPI001AE54F5C|nr:antiviral reverse transcriptase Drt4 [Herbaspirillum sp. 1130]MBP1317122.1 hypothetical protein [Herbaspirillum sp. 1130]